MSSLKLNSVGNRIANLRGKLGVSDFAEELGINRKTVTRWEADETLPDGASLLALKEKFGADPGWLLTGAGTAPDVSSLTPDEHVLLDGYRSLEPAMKKRMLAFMLGGDALPTRQAQSINVTSNGAPAAGGNITTHHGKFSGAKIGGVIEGDFTGTANVQVGKKTKP